MSTPSRALGNAPRTEPTHNASKTVSLQIHAVCSTLKQFKHKPTHPWPRHDQDFPWKFLFLHASVPFAKTIRIKPPTPKSKNYPNIGIVTSSTQLGFNPGPSHPSSWTRRKRRLYQRCSHPTLIKESGPTPRTPIHPRDGSSFSTLTPSMSRAPKNSSNNSQSEFTAVPTSNNSPPPPISKPHKYKAHLFFPFPHTPKYFDISSPTSISTFSNAQIALSSGNLCLGYPSTLASTKIPPCSTSRSPVFVGLDDHIPHRIHLIEKTTTRSITPYPNTITQPHSANKKDLTKLRQEIGSNKNPKDRNAGKIELLKNIGTNATPIIREKNVFYLPSPSIPTNPFCLHYHPPTTPHIIYNFRGNPPFLLQGLLSIGEQVNHDNSPTDRHPGSTPLIFRDRRGVTSTTTASYKNGDFKISPTKTSPGFNISPPTVASKPEMEYIP